MAVNICTYKRKEGLDKILSQLKNSLFFQQDTENEFFGRLYIVVVDNAKELQEEETGRIIIKHNPKGNAGGSGGFQYGIEVIRSLDDNITHVVFMDDDVEFEIISFYKLFLFLKTVDKENADRPVAGRMFRLDRRDVQYCAAEIWNGGDIRHIGFNKEISKIELEPEIDYSCGAEYGGWWFCCFPFAFVKVNDVMPFFLHCDDVEYGLRYGKMPIIIKEVRVWHETYEFRKTPIINYYDTRNPLFVNKKYNLEQDPEIILRKWKKDLLRYHINQEWDYEYYSIQAMWDYLKGIKWLYRIDPGKYHKKLSKKRISRYKNSLFWRIVEFRFKQQYKMDK